MGIAGPQNLPLGPQVVVWGQDMAQLAMESNPLSHAQAAYGLEPHCLQDRNSLTQSETPMNHSSRAGTRVAKHRPPRLITEHKDQQRAWAPP